ncbi:uncharacterized protein CBL_20516 [Carabus blaptoides fortunei]
MSTDSDSSKEHQHPHARLCHVIKNDNFDGYGFNLHAEKGKPGQYIGKVDEGSPAESAGLRQGDRIIEVNGASIANETHKQVVQRIKALPNETKLLVIDPEDETNNDNDNNVQPANIVIDSNSNASSKTASDASTALANNGQSYTEENMNSNNGSLNLSMTAAELRAKLAAKKKFDPRKESIDFKKKFDTVQKL